MIDMSATVTNYRAYQSGAMQGFFDLELHGLTILGCKVFSKDGRLWFAFPSQKIMSSSGETKYVDIITAAPAVLREIQDAVRPQLRAALGVTAEETRPFGGTAPRPGRRAGGSIYRTPEGEDISAYRSTPGDDGISF
jgi:hypothetical protein